MRRARGASTTYDKGSYLEDLSDQAIKIVASHLPQKNSPLSVRLLHRLDQAYSQAGEDDTAFSGGRSPRFAVFIVAVCPTPDLLAADRAWARPFWQARRPHSPGPGSYINAMTESDDDRARAAYGPAQCDRLAKIKAKHDPQNHSMRTSAGLVHGGRWSRLTAGSSPAQSLLADGVAVLDCCPAPARPFGCRGLEPRIEA